MQVASCVEGFLLLQRARRNGDFMLRAEYDLPWVYITRCLRRKAYHTTDSEESAWLKKKRKRSNPQHHLLLRRGCSFVSARKSIIVSMNITGVEP